MKRYRGQVEAVLALMQGGGCAIRYDARVPQDCDATSWFRYLSILTAYPKKRKFKIPARGWATLRRGVEYMS